MGRQIKRERYRQTLITGTGGLRQEYVVRIHLHELSFFNHMKSTLLTVEFIGPHHFNAADQMIGELDQINILCGVHTRRDAKFVLILTHVPHQVEPMVKQMARDLNVRANITRQTIHGIPQLYLRDLAVSQLRLKLRSVHCTPFGTNCFALTDCFSSGEIRCVRLHHIQLQHFQLVLRYSPTVYSIEMYNGQRHPPHAPVFALPKLGQATVVARNANLSSVRDSSWENESDFRNYWLSTHGINLAQDVGGYAMVRFFPKAAPMLYPACCLLTKNTICHQAVRSQGQAIKNDFIQIIMQAFSACNVTETIEAATTDSMASTHVAKAARLK